MQWLHLYQLVILSSRHLPNCERTVKVCSIFTLTILILMKFLYMKKTMYNDINSIIVHCFPNSDQFRLDYALTVNIGFGSTCFNIHNNESNTFQI